MRRLLPVALGCALLQACACGTVPSGNPRDAGVDPTLDAGAPSGCTGGTLAMCGGTCVNLAADRQNCGECGHACAEGGACIAGGCACPDQTVECGSVCANLEVDADHCGQCDTACAPGSVCSKGTCLELCGEGGVKCDGSCVDLLSDPDHCGACAVACENGRTCEGGTCACDDPRRLCDGVCADLHTDPAHCGACNTQCFSGFGCEDGACVCPPNRTVCGSTCADTRFDPNNCGGCSQFCQAGQNCMNGNCETPCPAGFIRCGAQCVDPQIDPEHCGACSSACTGGLSCLAGACVTCNSATTDCDSDGWTVAQGDCCDQPGAGCGTPYLVNPGALELSGDGVDNNCNGLFDSADVADTKPCDQGLPTNSTDPYDYAKALGICRTTTEVPATPADRTWGLISAQLLRADGSPATYPGASSIRPSFGTSVLPKEGQNFVVLASGIAADGSQTNPGPNGGPASTSFTQGTVVDIQTCTLPYCVSDWFAAPNPPLKIANQLPSSPGCLSASLGGNVARDSVMLVLRMRAPTNAQALQFRGNFFSSEYPEYVCTAYNDQFIALIDTPTAPPIGVLNPPDKNLMTYSNGGQRWPIGINVANGTSLFRVCESRADNPSCWDLDVSPSSCSEGATALAGTGFEQIYGAGSCTNGGATGWLTTVGAVRPGEIVELRIALWDAGDPWLDSLALLDDFRWLAQSVQPGTTD